MIDLAKSWTYNQARKKEKWKKRHLPAILHVWPLFTTILNKDSNSFVEFCWSELLVYKPLCSFSEDIGLSKEEITANWEIIKNDYHVWHVHRTPVHTPNEKTSEDEDNHITIQQNMEMNEWQSLSRLSPTGNINFTSLDMLGL